jgi:hypothetical protein
MKGNVVVYGLTMLLTEYKYTPNITASHWQGRGGNEGGEVAMMAGGAISLACLIHTLLHTFGQKGNDDNYIPFK